ncbi:MAG: ABC transporter permease [Chthoniobacterales bacterium]|nr:ABC transporter permease [Chthoniobacterales bacterium]
MKDFTYAFRMLVKSPAFSAIAIITLALGIGANSAIFSVVNTVLLRPLPFKNPEQLVMLWAHNAASPRDKDVASIPDFLDYQQQSRSFSALAAYTRAGAILNRGNDSQELEGLAITPGVFDVLRVQPILGRAFTKDDDKTGAPLVVVITHSLWQRAFGGDPKIVGQQILFSGRSYTVLGVMPPGWRYPIEGTPIDYVVPLIPMVPQEVNSRGGHFATVLGRLKPGVTTKAAEAEMNAISSRLAQQFPDTDLDRIISIVGMHEDVVGEIRQALLVMLGAVVLVLLIACANVANLLLARAAARSREIAIRAALGAGRGRIVRQLLAESLLLALLGGCGGLVLAWWGVDLLRVMGPQDLPRVGEIGISSSVCAFTFALCVLSTLVFGLVPALQISRSDVSQALQQGAKGSTSGQGNRARSALVIAQVALSLLLLAGAGLLIKSFLQLRATNPGFDPARAVIADISLPRLHYSEADKQIRFFDQLMPKLAALPGLEAVGGVNPLPFSGNSRGSSFIIAGQSSLAKGEHPGASHLTVKPDYFRAMNIPLLAGRAFNERDNETAPKVIMVNAAFAKKFLPNENPIGHQIVIDRDDPNPPAWEIIGVVGDTHHDTLKEAPEPEFYVPFPQNPERRVYLVLRTASPNLTGLDSAVARAIHGIDPDVYLPRLRPLSSLLSESLAAPRFDMLLLAIFASVAMALAAIGIYGVIAYSVTQRTKEIGIRMALGAQRRDMLRMILRQSLTMVGIGLTIGLLAAFLGTRLLKSLLYGVSANDLTIYGTVVLLLSAAALLASYIPARRAMKVNPIVALHYE